MITVTLQYDTLQEAHAALGNMLAQAVVAPTAATPDLVVPLTKEGISGIDDKIDVIPATPEKKKRGRPRKKTPKVYSSEEVAALKDEFSAFTKDKGFIKAKALLNEFEDVRRFGDLSSLQHEKFHTLMTEAA